MPTKHLQQLLDEYGKNHQHPINKLIHWIMVPLIFFAITALLWTVSLSPGINAAIVLSIPIALYYLTLSPKLGIGMMLFNAFCLTLCYLAEKHIEMPLWQVALMIFIPAWIGQFIGHYIEGRKPSFLKDLQFLLIGPAWLMAILYQRFSISEE